MGLRRIGIHLISFIQHQEKYGIAHAFFHAKQTATSASGRSAKLLLRVL